MCTAVQQQCSGSLQHNAAVQFYAALSCAASHLRIMQRSVNAFVCILKPRLVHFAASLLGAPPMHTGQCAVAEQSGQSLQHNMHNVHSTKLHTGQCAEQSEQSLQHNLQCTQHKVMHIVHNARLHQLVKSV